MKQHLAGLERVAGEMNAWLFALAIGLAVLDLTVLAAKSIPPLPATPAAIGSGKLAPAAEPTASPKAPAAP